MAVTTRFFSNVSASSGGLEIPNILGGVPNVDSGYIRQVIVRAVSGGGATAQIEIRYEEGDSSRENLVYLYEGASLPFFVDSCIDAPFDLKGPNTTEDLAIFIQPDVAGVFEIRIDMDIDRFRNTI